MIQYVLDILKDKKYTVKYRNNIYSNCNSETSNMQYILLPDILLDIEEHNVEIWCEEKDKVEALLIHCVSSIQKSNSNTLQTLYTLIEKKDIRTWQHSQGVAQLAQNFTRFIQENSYDKQLATIDRSYEALSCSCAPTALYTAGLLHDVGKVIIPEWILNKPTSLDKEEFSVVKQHAVWSYEIIASAEYTLPLAPHIKAHHENWNGSGYPDGLQGFNIPVGGRLLALCDRYDAIMRPRTYKMASDPNIALHLLGLDFVTEPVQLDPYLGILFLLFILSITETEKVNDKLVKVAQEQYKKYFG